jgi:acetylornithine deacetylase/succinyl-diaminopimelate desuccinylase-like protein
LKRLAGLAAAALALATVLACSRRERRPGPELADQRRPPAEWLNEEPVRLLRDYVRLDTSLRNGEEEGARFLERVLSCDAIETEVVCPEARRCNLLARLPGRTREGALLLLNHIDVAPVVPAFWKAASPFEGKIENGFLYGRGAYDMKSLALAQALAIRSLKRHGIVPARDILFLAEADEEVGQKWGARWLLEHRPEWFRGVRFVLNEGGTNEMILREVRFWGLETLQAGYGFAELQAANASDLERLSSRWPARLADRGVPPHPHVVVGFDLLANHLGSPLTDPLRHLDRVWKNPAELAILPDRYGSFFEPRVRWSPVYPYPPEEKTSSRAFVTVSTPPGVSPEPILERIGADAKASAIRPVHSFASEATTASPYPTPFTDLLQRVTEARFPGIPFGPVPTTGGYTTSILFRKRGFDTYGYSPIPINITDAARRHGNDERIFLRDYLDGVRVLEDVLAEFAMVPLRERKGKSLSPGMAGK